MGTFLTIFIILLFVLVLYLVISNYKKKVYFESRGVPYAGNGIYNTIITIVKGINVIDTITLQYKKMKSKYRKLEGSNDFGMTNLSIIDPTLVRSILVKDFDHFTDRRQVKSEGPTKEIFMTKMLLFLTGEKWKSLRSKLSPTFTTGKIKRVFPLFNDSGKKLVKFVEQEMHGKEEIDLMEGYSKFTMDIIASAVCGIDSQAFDQKEASVFEKMAMKLQLTFSGILILKIIFMLSLPKLWNFFEMRLFPKDVEDFFNTAIKSSIHHRQENNENRNDFLQLMLEARDDKLKLEESELESFEKDAVIINKASSPEPGSSSISKCQANELLDDDGIVANALLFMLAGYDTTQSLLIFCAYSLALNPEVQGMLRDEIENVLGLGEGNISYDELNKMTYLDMVISETLRYYPPAVATDRACTMDYKVPGTEFVLKKDQGIIIPIYAIHHDEEYYPEPEKFNPERFSAENKGKINQYTYLPFGQGPRNCIGMRFALAEVKIAIAHLVYNFRIEPSKKTLIPMKFSRTTSLKPEGGMFLALNKIQR